MEIVNVKEVIGSKLATSSDKGLLLYKILVEKEQRNSIMKFLID